jgi:NhaP-type Na+/H+ or K+/H+ antiporter
MPDALTAFGIVALIFLIAALISGLVERAPISFPMVFLGLGFLLGPHALGLIDIGPHDTTLETIATFNLALVLFLDALNLRFDEIASVGSQPPRPRSWPGVWRSRRERNGWDSAFALCFLALHVI